MLAKQKDAFGYGKVYRSLMAGLKFRTDVEIVDSAKKADVQITYCQPLDNWKVVHWWARDRHPKEVLYTTWETDTIPEVWHEVIDTFQAIASPSKWLDGVFQKNGVSLPSYVIRHGVEQAKFPYVERKIDNAESTAEISLWPGKKFVFLWEGMAMSDRKGRIYVERAFEIVKNKFPDIWLIEKIYPFSSVDGMPDIVDTTRNITQIRRFMDFKEYLDLAKLCHAFVYPSRGEAFGLMPLEKLATGMPVATTSWSGQTEYLNDKYFRPLKYTLSEKGNDFFSTMPFLNFTTSKGRDAIPDVDDIATAMIDFYENRVNWFEKARLGSRWVHDYWSWDIAVDDFINCAKSVEGGANVVR